jgi:hypothetical protein
MRVAELIIQYRTDAASTYGKLRSMSRNELLAEARAYERGPDETKYLAEWCRIFAANIFRKDEARLKRNWDRFERDILDPSLGKRMRGEAV